MKRKQKPIIAICYDFDGTLSPGNMQEYDFFPKLKMKPKKFWEESKKKAKAAKADEILAYMFLMLRKADQKDVEVTRSAFAEYGKKLKLYQGVSGWFKRINALYPKNGFEIQHFVISSGLREMIEGSKISKNFKKTYASSFMYDNNDVACWPAQAINYTTKTQFLFRINKGILDEWDNKGINDYLPKEERPIPFSRMIYIGDGSTDIPCMKLVKDQGGYSIAVYKSHTKSKKEQAQKLLRDGRVNFIAPADYSKNGILDKQIKSVIGKMMEQYKVWKGEKENPSMRSPKQRNGKKANGKDAPK